MLQRYELSRIYSALSKAAVEKLRAACRTTWALRLFLFSCGSLLGHFFTRHVNSSCTSFHGPTPHHETTLHHNLWTFDATPADVQKAELRSKDCYLSFHDRASSDTRSQDLLSTVYRDTRIIFPYTPTGDVESRYWKVMPHPCSESRTIESRMNGDGHGFETIFQTMLEGVPGSSVFVDVGANMGAYTIFPAVRGVRVISFEVMIERVHEIRLMAALNGVAERVKVINGAVSGLSSGFLVCRDQRPTSVLVDECSVVEERVTSNVERLITAPRVRMDDFVSEADDVYVVKVDCDGCEEGWFRGSQRFMMGPGLKVAFYLLEVELHANWLAEFETIVEHKHPWYVVTEFHEHAHLNPDGVKRLVTAAKAKNTSFIEQSPLAHNTLYTLRKAVDLLVLDASRIRVDLLVIILENV